VISCTIASALAGSDYLARPGTLVFPAGATERTLHIPIIGDRCAEPDESFQLQLFAPSHAVLAANEVTGRILNDDSVSSLRVVDLARVGEGWRVDFASACDRSYRLLRSDRLDGTSWIIVAEQILGTGAVISVLDTTPMSSSQAFYRIEIVP
jgi:hypothetical protein